MKSISGLEASSDTTEPGYFKLVTVSSFCPFTLTSLLVPFVCHQRGLLGTDLHAVGCGGFSRHSTNFASSSSSPAKPSMSSAKWRFVIVLPPMLKEEIKTGREKKRKETVRPTEIGAVGQREGERERERELLSDCLINYILFRNS